MEQDYLKNVKHRQMSFKSLSPGEKAAFSAAAKMFSADGASFDDDFERPSLSFPDVQ